MDNLTVTITNPRLIDGFVQAAINNNRTPESIAQEFLENQGRSYADLFKIGVITSASFISRFTPSEYGAIISASQVNENSTEEEIVLAQSVSFLISELTNSPNVALDDPRLEPGLQELVDAGLITEERKTELLSYQRPEV